MPDSPAPSWPTADFEQVEILRDEGAGLLAFVAIHSTRLGPAFGGIRRWRYADPEDALRDALRLASHMTRKCAIHGIPGGGGKAVVVDRPELQRERAYRRLGEFVELLGGRFHTGPDVGTEARDLRAVASATRFVAAGGEGELAAATARGVLAGIRAVAARLGRDDLAGVRIVVQGLGEVGGQLCRLLHAAGARLTVADLLPERVARVVADLAGVAAVAPHDAPATPCDVFAPCALGGVVDAAAVGALRCRAVAGSANNVLASAAAGLALHRAGIAYAPDFVINSGGLLHGALSWLDGDPPPPARIDAIGPLVGEILDRAAAAGEPPEATAERLAGARLAAAPDGMYFPARR